MCSGLLIVNGPAARSAFHSFQTGTRRQVTRKTGTFFGGVWLAAADARGGERPIAIPAEKLLGRRVKLSQRLHPFSGFDRLVHLFVKFCQALECFFQTDLARGGDAVFVLFQPMITRE
jgi:hypothetical protein